MRSRISRRVVPTGTVIWRLREAFVKNWAVVAEGRLRMDGMLWSRARKPGAVFRNLSVKKPSAAEANVVASMV